MPGRGGIKRPLHHRLLPIAAESSLQKPRRRVHDRFQMNNRNTRRAEVRVKLIQQGPQDHLFQRSGHPKAGCPISRPLWRDVGNKAAAAGEVPGPTACFLPNLPELGLSNRSLSNLGNAMFRLRRRGMETADLPRGKRYLRHMHIPLDDRLHFLRRSHRAQIQ